MGATNKGHQTPPLTSKHPSDPQKAGEYQMREACNYAHKDTHAYKYPLPHTLTHFDLTYYLFIWMSGPVQPVQTL